ncbi:unnamed protein product [Symbiodinium sp. CCMP2592]|nr:unnamed protein product [Symbiodinium sp. CCMP2592]
MEVLTEGHSKLLALTWPESGRTAPVAEALCVPIMKRREGVMLCIPCGFLSLAALDEGDGAEALSLMGPSFQCTVPFGTLDEQGAEHPLDIEAAVLLLDVSVDVLPLLREVGDDMVSDTIFPFVMHQPEAFPLSEDLLAAARKWIAESPEDRCAFYSAQEEPPAEEPAVEGKAKAKKAQAKRKVTTADLAQQMSLLTTMLPQLAEQLTAVKERQEQLEKHVQPGASEPAPSPAKPAHQQPFLPPRGPGLPVAKQASLLGPPPRTRPVDQAGAAAVVPTVLAEKPPSAPAPADAFQAAMLQQSQALSALVGQLVAQQDGGLGDLSASGSTSYVGSKGAARREKLQSALAARSGDFYLAVLQAASRRMRPSSPCPTSVEDCSGQVSMCQYLERFGGYAGHRETGYIMWSLAHIMDCLTAEDYAGAREHVALTAVAIDQSVIDGGRWDFAWLLTLLEEPPAQLFHGRGLVANPRTRAFSPLSPVGWTTCALQYLKEVDLITTRRLETLGPTRQQAAPPAGESEGQDANKPKKGPRLAKPAPPSEVIFPMPLPSVGSFASFSLERSQRFRRRVMHHRLLHIVCMALNFLHSNFVPIPLSVLQRPLNAAQRSLVAHLGRHLKAFGASAGEFVLADSGRRNPQLIARLSELTSFLAASAAATGDPYADRSGTVVPMHNEAHAGLDPFRSLNTSRLKLSGQGLWNPLPHLPEELYMAFAEPRSLLHGLPPPASFVPVWTRESPSEVASLARLWDSLGLLRLTPALLSPSESYLLARAFNCYKGPDKDRMIIDRRGQNWAESRLSGPSLYIPVGPMLGMLEVRPHVQSVYCAAADRKDFYHQLRATGPKALSNRLGPALPLVAVRDMQAFQHLLPSEGPGGACDSAGRRSARRASLLFDPGHYFVCFGAVAQGDHLGVEVGTSAHENVLLAGGLLSEDVRLCSNRPFRGLTEAQGLVIDDYFALCVKDLRDPSGPVCVDRLRLAKDIYQHEGLVGSDDKDIWGEPKAKIAGAEICSGPETRSRGLVTVAAPAEKRIALSLLSLEAARLSHVTDALWLSLVGSWTSAALFRRPLMAVFSEVYKVAPAGAAKASRPKLFCLTSRAAAQEITLVSVLAPLAACDLSAPFVEELFATDASEQKGGYTVAPLGVEVIRPLWRTASRKGGYSRLFSKEEMVLARFEDREPFDLRMVDEGDVSDPSWPLAYHFDFLEVGAAGGRVSELLRARGRVVGPVIDPANSPFYDLSADRTFEWLCFLLQHNRVKCLFVVVPPSVLGSSQAPGCSEKRGLRRPSSVACRSLALVACARACGVLALLLYRGAEGPVLASRLSRLRAFGAIPGSTCFCAFGSAGCLDCKFLAFGLDPSPLTVPCCRRPFRARQPAHQQPFLPRLLAQALATEFDSALRRVSHVKSLRRLQPLGLENHLLNDIVLSLHWEVGDSWCWRSASHINILETASVLRLIRTLARRGPCRVVILVDSSVALHSCAKGRSPSRGLSPVLRKIASLCLLAGIYPAFHFVPTRLNPGDCPTRDLVLPDPAPASFWPGLGIDELYEGLALPKLRRWASNWARLVCLVASCPPAFRPHLGWRQHHCGSRLFDSTLGFPGEGPFFRVFGVLGWFQVALAMPSHVLLPRHAADEKRSAARATAILVEGRPVEPVTQRRRDKLLEAFGSWLLDQGVVFSDLFDLSPLTTKKLNGYLVGYGRQLFDAGWPYSHYSEVINAISSKEPALRRSLQPAWDLAFAWLREEPHSHHVALPWQVLLSAITLALLWGWPRVAGMLALTWGAVMRVGETLAARRCDLLLPEDVQHTIGYALVSISEPKTRFKAARHQSAKLDQPDLLEIVQFAFGSLSPESKLWPLSPSTLRSRFDSLMVRLGTHRWEGQGSRSLDLGSLRAGGATWLLQTSEDSELVRRRGRWLNSRTMEIYIQEISSIQFVHRLTLETRRRVFSLLDSFRSVLLLSKQLQEASTPCHQWFFFFAGGARHS